MNKIKNRALIMAIGNTFTAAVLMFGWVYWTVWGINRHHWPCVVVSALFAVLYLRDAVKCARKAIAEANRPCDKKDELAAIRDISNEG